MKDPTMNTLSNEKKTLILSLLSEGNSIRSVERMSGVHRDTIMRLMVSAGERCSKFLDEEMRDLQVNKLHVDEIWSYVGKHQKRVTPEENNRYIGDQYIFVAMDSETKLIPAFRLSKRDSRTALSFMMELKTRIVTKFQLSTDAFPPYVPAVDRVWGNEIDYGQVQKDYVAPPEKEASRRYTPGRIIQATRKVISGSPKWEDISTSHIERQNLSMRMGMRRLTRLTNAYSKKWENLKAALALYFWHYNFARVHETLRVTPAMEAGLAQRILTWNDLLRWQQAKQAA
jgi:IS1 family transposase